MEITRKSKTKYRHQTSLLVFLFLMFISPLVVFILSVYFNSIKKYMLFISLGVVLFLKVGFLYLCYLNIRRKTKKKNK